MLITDADWEALGPHVNAYQLGAPRPIYLALAALVPVDEITQSWVHSDATQNQPTTTWSVWGATSTLLGHVDLTFDYPFYDSSEESDRREVSTHINAAWARPLSSITALRLSGIGPMVAATHSQGHWYGFSGAITFADGFETALPQPPAPHLWADHQRWDNFTQAIRSAIR